MDATPTNGHARAVEQVEQSTEPQHVEDLTVPSWMGSPISNVCGECITPTVFVRVERSLGKRAVIVLQEQHQMDCSRFLEHNGITEFKVQI